MLEEICASSEEDCKRFVSSNDTELTKLLLESIVSTSPPSLAVSLHCAAVGCYWYLLCSMTSVNEQAEFSVSFPLMNHLRYQTCICTCSIIFTYIIILIVLFHYTLSGMFGV